MAERHETKRKGLAVRLKPEEKERFDALRKRLGLTQAGLIMESISVLEEVINLGVEGAAKRWQRREETE